MSRLQAPPLECRELKMLLPDARITVGLQVLAKLSKHDSRMTVLRLDLVSSSRRSFPVNDLPIRS